MAFISGRSGKNVMIEGVGYIIIVSLFNNTLKGMDTRMVIFQVGKETKYTEYEKPDFGKRESNSELKFELKLYRSLVAADALTLHCLSEYLKHLMKSRIQVEK